MYTVLESYGSHWVRATQRLSLRSTTAATKTEVTSWNLLMPGLTSCPFCQSNRIRARLPVSDLHEYECADCMGTWLVARPKRQAKIVAFPGPAARARRRTGTRKG